MRSLSLPRLSSVFLTAVVLCGIDVVSIASLSAEEPMSISSGYAVLRKSCLSCHGDDFKYPGLDLRDRATLVKPRDPTVKPFLVVGKPDSSRIWQRANGGGMPPDDQPQLTSEELNTLRKWIEEGADFPINHRPARHFIGERTLLKVISQDVASQPSANRSFLRYLSLAHLWNNSEISDEQLRIVRAGVSKLINSLSGQRRIAVPAMIDPDGLVLRIDLRDYGWDHRRHWLSLLKVYPYGLQVSAPEAQKVYELTDCDLPYLRADWFVFHASRPPLYHQLVTLPEYVGIPEKLSVLERLLGVDVEENFKNDRLSRAGFSGEKSGVSDHNRIVERHDSKYGYYWPSIDSAGDSDRKNFFNFPLGPKRPGRPNLGAFDHDGGEIIFSLPNGLQAYMLVKSDGTRINEGPLAIVNDANRFSGSNVIVNGISCMGCHKQGMIPLEDSIRSQYINRPGDIANKVLRLYPEQAVMNRLVERDRKQFLDSLDEATGSLLRTEPDDVRQITLFPEPITAVSKLYDRPLKLADTARELGLPETAEVARENGIKATASEFATVIKFSERLRSLELQPLTTGESLTRTQWERAFQPTARELGTGTPIQVE